MTTPDDERILAELEALVDSLSDSPKSPDRVVELMLRAVSGSATATELMDVAAEELEFRFWELCPADESPLGESALRHLDALCHLALTEPRPELAWTLLSRIDTREPPPAEVVAEIGRLFAMPGVADTEVRAGAFQRRGIAFALLGATAESVADWEAAYALTDDADARIDCAVRLAEALAESGDPVGAADWAWRLGELLEQAEPPVDAEALRQVWAFQLAAIVHLQDIDGRIDIIRRLFDRLLARFDWALDEITEQQALILAASAAIQDNDLEAARKHLAAAHGFWDESDPYTRAHWHITRGEAAAMASDIILLEESIREATPYVQGAGDDEMRSRLSDLIRIVARVHGGTDLDPPDDASAMFVRLAAEFRARAPVAADLDELERVARACTPAQRHLIVACRVVEAMVNLSLGRPDEGRRDLARARAAHEDLLATPGGGIPIRLDALVSMGEALLEIGTGQRQLGVSILERLWREDLAAGRLARVAAPAMAAAAVWNEALSVPLKAMEAATVALTSLQELRAARADVRDRDEHAVYFAAAHRLAIDAAAATRSPELMAELLEVIRAQAMPYAAEVGSASSGPIGSLLSSVLTSPDERAADATRDVMGATAGATGSADTAWMRLLPPPLIQMPWGTVALAPWLAYPAGTARPVATLSLDGFD